MFADMEGCFEHAAGANVPGFKGAEAGDMAVYKRLLLKVDDEANHNGNKSLLSRTPNREWLDAACIGNKKLLNADSPGLDLSLIWVSTAPDHGRKARMQMFVKILKESLRDDLKIDGYSWDDMHERLKEACGKADLVEFVSGLDMDRFVFFEKPFETCQPQRVGDR